MRRKCVLCGEKMSSKGKRVCFLCLNKGPYGHENYLAALYACKGVNGKGKPCRQWSQIGKAYCNAHGEVDE